MSMESIRMSDYAPRGRGVRILLEDSLENAQWRPPIDPIQVPFSERCKIARSF